MKLLACDYDGTLYDENQQIKEVDVEAIVKFQQEGNLFGMCTGRAHSILIPYIDQRIQPDFYIAAAGAQIYDKNKKPLVYNTFKLEYALEIIDMYWDKTLLIYGANHNYSNYPQTFVDCFEVISSKDEMKETQMEEMTIFFNSTEEALKEAAILEKKFPEITFMVNSIVVDIIPKGFTKQTGLEYIKNYFNLDLKDMAGIGDGLNDIPMLTYCHTGFTFPHVDQKIQEKATHIVKNIKEAIDLLV